jgi:hypothetical protein
MKHRTTSESFDHSVDPYRDEAITFTDIVQHRFSREAEPHS